MSLYLKPNTITHLCCLITGDRFYFANDTTKQVWEIRFHTFITLHGQQIKLSQCKNDKQQVQRFNSNQVAIYLRSNNVRRLPGYRKKQIDNLDWFFIH